MNDDLFRQSKTLQRIPIPDAEIYYLRSIDIGVTPESLLYQLISNTVWRSETVIVWGKKFVQPRLIAWYGDAGRAYTYSGIKLDPLPWTKLLIDVKLRIEAISAATFNSVLLNYYRDNRDSMGFHSDDEPELGDKPTIASLSLGEQRTFVLKHKRDLNLKSVRLELASSSLLLMKGDTQKNWKHGILKKVRSCGPRINLTFRQIICQSKPKFHRPYIDA
jgi:alkylated DNA repair dioxygenase AlkB